jgi:hypothetical protein
MAPVFRLSWRDGWVLASQRLNDGLIAAQM